MTDLVVGVLGARASPEVQQVRAALRARGARARLVDLSGFPSVRRATATLHELRAGGTRLDDVGLWWLRHLEVGYAIAEESPPATRRALREDVGAALIADREVRAFLESFSWSLCDVARVINHPGAAALHGRKPLLVARLRRAGVPVPVTLTTTDRAAAAAFVDEHGGQVLCKPAAGGGEARLAAAVLAETTGDGLEGPLLFQRRITGGASLRAYAVRDHVVACREVVHGDVVDWRADQRALRPVADDPRRDEIVVRATRAAGLAYAGIDLEIDGEGRPWVIDVNPSPLFASFASASGEDVAGPIAEMLIDEASR